MDHSEINDTLDEVEQVKNELYSLRETLEQRKYQLENSDEIRDVYLNGKLKSIEADIKKISYQINNIFIALETTKNITSNSKHLRDLMISMLVVIILLLIYSLLKADLN